MNIGNFFDRIYRIINKFNATEKKPRDYGLDKPIFHSELHMIEVIGDFPGITASQLSKTMAITKGAVSQTTSKLLSRNLIERKNIPGTSNTAKIYLTEKGICVFNQHRKFHENMTKKIQAVLNEASPETLADLDLILEIIDSSLDEYEKVELGE